MFLSTLNWFKATDRSQYFTAPGDHADATVEKKQAFLEAATTNTGQFLVELAAAGLKDLYE